MPRLVGLGYASVLYRQIDELKSMKTFSDNGNEIAWGTIGNASTAEGMFWEALNAIGVLRAPVILAVYDDGYGISVPNELQLTHPNLSRMLEGFKRSAGSHEGFDLYRVPGWDYPELRKIFNQAARNARREHIPAVVHVIELTQPLGHSTSGSQERYKPANRLAWEKENDTLEKFTNWILEQGLAESDELERINHEARELVENARQQAWEAFQKPILEERTQLAGLIQQAQADSNASDGLEQVRNRLLGLPLILRRDLDMALQEALLIMKDASLTVRQPLIEWRSRFETRQRERYSSHLYSQSSEAALKIEPVAPAYTSAAAEVYGYEILNA